MKAELIRHNGVEKISINGEIVSSVSFRSFWPGPETTRQFAQGGTRLMSVYPTGRKCSLDVPYSQFGEFWIGEGKYNWDALRNQMNQFIANAPDAYFSLILQLDTRDWFLKEHPDCKDSFFYLPEAESYEPWRKAILTCIKDTLTFLDREYPEKIYAVYVCAGRTNEWFSIQPIDGEPNKEQAFRRWCRNSARHLPDVKELNGNGHGLILSEKEKNAVDYWHFLADLNAETILECAREVKRHNPGLLVGCFCGYIYCHDEHIGDSCHNGMIRRLLCSPDIDLFFSPASYKLRGLEDVSNSHMPMASLHLHRKLYYHEIDNTPYPANRNPYAQVLQMYAHRRHDCLRQSIMYARRESSAALAALGTYWWFDMFGGWFDDPALRKALFDIQKAQRRLYEKPICSNAEIAYFIDEESEMHLARNNLLHAQIGELQMRALGRIGAQVDYYEAEDLLHSDFPQGQYKLFIFADLIAPSDAIREAVSRLRARGASLLFFYAPGILRNGRMDEASMEELTGIRLKLSRQKFGYTVAEAGEYNDAGMPRVFGGEMEGAATFVEADEPDECVFARGLSSGAAQFAVKTRRDGSFDAWIAQPVVPDCVLRPLAKRAGCFCVTDEGLPVYTNSRMLSVYDHKGGNHAIHPCWKSGKLVELYTGETYCLSEKQEITMHFEPDECKCFLHEEEA